jgi:hypothetical protein
MTLRLMSNPNSRPDLCRQQAALAEIRELLAQMNSHEPPGWGRAAPEQFEPPLNGSRTLQAIVCELLRPRLQRWLDENLPRLVEPKVRAEVTEALRLSANTHDASFAAMVASLIMRHR